MYRNILLAYDGSDADQKSLLGCKDLENWSSAKITLLTVTSSYYVSMGIDGGFIDNETMNQDERVQVEILNAGVQSLKTAGYEAKGVCLKGDPAIEIASYAEKNNCDLIIVGHKHETNWAARWWGGFKSKALIEVAPCSVLIVILK